MRRRSRAADRARSGVLVYTNGNTIYTGTVTKRLIDIDDELLERAQQAAGTETIKATVEIALRRLLAGRTAVEHVARLRRRGLDLARIDEARRPRLGSHG